MLIQRRLRIRPRPAALFGATMNLECRQCERLLKISAFTTYHRTDDLWTNAIAHGADLACLNCQSKLGLGGPQKAIIYCENCQQMKRKRDFSAEMQEHWTLMRDDVSIHCKRCTEGTQKGKQPVDEELFRCCGPECTKEEEPWKWSEIHFLPQELVDAVHKNRTPQCARCEVSGNALIRDTAFTCEGCGELKPLREFPAVVCKQWLQGERRCYKKCFDCQYPECAITGCNKRPSSAVSHNHVDSEGNWYCHSHRYPPCGVSLLKIVGSRPVALEVLWRDRLGRISRPDVSNLRASSLNQIII